MVTQGVVIQEVADVDVRATERVDPIAIGVHACIVGKLACRTCY